MVTQRLRQIHSAGRDATSSLSYGSNVLRSLFFSFSGLCSALSSLRLRQALPTSSSHDPAATGLKGPFNWESGHPTTKKGALFLIVSMGLAEAPLTGWHGSCAHEPITAVSKMCSDWLAWVTCWSQKKDVGGNRLHREWGSAGDHPCRPPGCPLPLHPISWYQHHAVPSLYSGSQGDLGPLRLD